MRISAVVAMAQNRAIGLQGQLPWRLPEDLKHFKKLTLGYPVIMGRKTFESIGRPLPGRLNIVVSRNPSLNLPESVLPVKSLSDAFSRCPSDCGEVFVIGGADIYQQAMSYLDRIYLTWIEQDFAGDTFFPEIPDAFVEVETQSCQSGSLRFSFKTLDRLKAN